MRCRPRSLPVVEHHVQGGAGGPGRVSPVLQTWRLYCATDLLLRPQPFTISLTVGGKELRVV